MAKTHSAGSGQARSAGSGQAAKQAIRAWYKRHPKTFCPVVGQAVCRHNGCDNAQLRADHRCNIALKMQMAERAQRSSDPRAWLADLRLTPDRRRYALNFPFDRMLLQDFRSVIPAADRAYDEETREWRVERRHWAALNALFSNFAEWDLIVTKT